MKQIRNNYYLYSVTSHYSREKGYPVSEQRYIGKITEEGLIEPDKITFTPGVDKLMLLKDAFDLGSVSEKDKAEIHMIPILMIGTKAYTGHLSRKKIAVLRKYFNYEDGVIQS